MNIFSIANILLGCWLLLVVLSLAFVVRNEIKRERKRIMGARLLNRYCLREVLYAVKPKDSKGRYRLNDAFSIQFNRLECDLNLSLYVNCYIFKKNHISEQRFLFKEVYWMLTDKKNDIIKYSL